MPSRFRDIGVMWGRILFEEACTTVIDAVQHMPQLKTLHLEPIAEDSLCPEALFTLGKNIQELCILGEQPFSNYPTSRTVDAQVLSLNISMCALKKQPFLTCSASMRSGNIGTGVEQTHAEKDVHLLCM